MKAITPLSNILRLTSCAFCLTSLALLPLTAEAYIASQSFTLAKGWNALFFEVTPTEKEAPDQVFADAGITKALCYLPDALESTASYDADGNAITAQPVSFRQWVRGDEIATDLAAVRGGMIYLVCATNKGAKIELKGDPALPHFHWRKATQSGEGFASLAAPSIDTAETKLTAQQFFGEGPWNGNFQESYRFLGTRKMPVASPLPQARYTLVPGTAYGFTSTRDCDWPGVVDVTGVGSDGVTFAADETEVSFQIRNAGTTNRVISLTYESAEGEGYRNVPLTEFATTKRLEYEIGPGESALVTLHSDPTARTDSALPYAGMLVARDETGGTKMRVRFSVRAEKAEAKAWPKGVYAGSFTLYAVGVTNVATMAGGQVKGSLMMVVDADGYPTLLQRLVIGSTNGVVVIGQDLEDLPEGVRGDFKRYSSVTMDPYQPAVKNMPREAIASGRAATFGWNVAYDSPVNPNFHAWHPDHDGAQKLSDGTWEKLPSGDDFTKYQSATKPELFSVSNSVQLVFGDVGWNENETLSGKIRWKLFGLKANVGGDGSILCTGTFSMKRISSKERLDK